MKAITLQNERNRRERASDQHRNIYPLQANNKSETSSSLYECNTSAQEIFSALLLSFLDLVFFKELNWINIKLNVSTLLLRFERVLSPNALLKVIKFILL